MTISWKYWKTEWTERCLCKKRTCRSSVKRFYLRSKIRWIWSKETLKKKIISCRMFLLKFIWTCRRNSILPAGSWRYTERKNIMWHRSRRTARRETGSGKRRSGSRQSCGSMPLIQKKTFSFWQRTKKSWCSFLSRDCRSSTVWGKCLFPISLRKSNCAPSTL